MGQVAVVTGAGQGIGRGVAEVLARAGYALALLDSDAASLAESAALLQGGPVLAVPCDVTHADQVDAAVSRVVVELGAPDVLVNNAGIMRRGALEEVSLEDWRAVMAVNVDGVFLCTQRVGREMLARGHGAIVNIASIVATMPQPFMGAYSPSKAAVLLLTTQTALEWGPRGIRCNAISPGLIRTRGGEAAYANPELHQRRRSLVPSRSVGSPRDIGEAVLFLVSAPAAYVNGAELRVDGGLAQGFLDQIPWVTGDGRWMRREGTYGDERDAAAAEESAE